MEGEVRVKEEEIADVLVLRISGRLDAVSSPTMEKQLLGIVEGGRHKIMLDFSGVDYLSSAGMRMLLAVTKRLKSLSGAFVVCSVRDNVMDVLKMSGFDHVLDLAPGEEQAMAKFKTKIRG